MSIIFLTCSINLGKSFLLAKNCSSSKLDVSRTRWVLIGIRSLTIRFLAVSYRHPVLMKVRYPVLVCYLQIDHLLTPSSGLRLVFGIVALEASFPLPLFPLVFFQFALIAHPSRGP